MWHIDRADGNDTGRVVGTFLQIGNGGRHDLKGSLAIEVHVERVIFQIAGIIVSDGSAAQPAAAALPDR